MADLIDLLMSFTPDQQAMVAGLVISALVYLLRLIAPALFADESSMAKFRRMVGVAVLTAFAALLACSAEGPTLGCWGRQFVIMLLTNQAAHSMVSNITRAVKDK